jgi:hypothetical protein
MKKQRILSFSSWSLQDHESLQDILKYSFLELPIYSFCIFDKYFYANNDNFFQVYMNLSLYSSSLYESMDLEED